MSEKRIVAMLDERTHKPVIQFIGDWLGKEVKLIMAHLPRNYRLSKAAMLKKLEEQKQGEDDYDRSSEPDSGTTGPAESEPDTGRIRSGEKRTGRTKGKGKKTGRRTKADKGRKARLQNQSVLLRADEGGEEEKEGSKDAFYEPSSDSEAEQGTA